MMLANATASDPEKILLLGAHCDDIEIGCGGAILHYLKKHPKATFTWVVFCSNPIRAEEARASAIDFVGDIRLDFRIFSFRDGYLPWLGIEIKDAFEKIKNELCPDLIFTHHREDRHQDHRIISDLTWNTWRDHFIMEYEVPKYDGDGGHPNVFLSVPPENAQRKIELLMRHFTSQRTHPWFTPDTFQALLRLRGVESGVPLAEAFYGRKMLWS